jgi:hypothetical protein
VAEMKYFGQPGVITPEDEFPNHFILAGTDTTLKLIPSKVAER